jgi:hypothetical protein
MHLIMARKNKNGGMASCIATAKLIEAYEF